MRRVLARSILIGSLLVSGCAHAGPRPAYLLPASIPNEDRVCVEKWPPGMERWYCIEIGDLRDLLTNLARANP